MGAFDHLKWSYDGAFEQLFGQGREVFSKNFPKIQMPGELPGGGGMLKLRFDWYISSSSIQFVSKFMVINDCFQYKVTQQTIFF